MGGIGCRGQLCSSRHHPGRSGEPSGAPDGHLSPFPSVWVPGEAQPCPPGQGLTAEPALRARRCTHLLQPDCSVEMPPPPPPLPRAVGGKVLKRIHSVRACS